MKYSPQILTENVNISKRTPIKDFLILLSGISGFLILSYILLGYITDQFILKVPISVENRISKLISDNIKIDINNKYQAKIDKIFNKIKKANNIENIICRAYYSKTKIVNAFAFIGGNIIVYSGLIDTIKYENELAFVLAHELGHIVHRDHYRKLSRILSVIIISSFIFGSDSSITRGFEEMIKNTELKFSRNDELKADIFALETINKIYGHCGGAEQFFKILIKRMKDKKWSEYSYYFSDHPAPKERCKNIQKIISSKKYSVKKCIELKFN